MTIEGVIADFSSRPFDEADLERLARMARDEGEEEKALPLLERAVDKMPSARLWQWKGLLERSIDELGRALESFAEAARLNPTDVGIAHGRARIAMEAGLDAQPLYEHARRLAPRNGALVVGLAAARVAAGRGEQGAAELKRALQSSPLWLEGHQQLAQIEATLGRSDEATHSIEEAIARHPKNSSLWETLLHIQLRRGAYETLKPIVDRAERAGVESPEFAIYRGIHAAQFSDETYPGPLFADAPHHAQQALRSWRIRHLLRCHAVEAVLPIIDEALRVQPTGELWAYASTAWRLANDSRSDWLEGESRLVSTIDLAATLPGLEHLSEYLRSLHVARGEYLDQSVRGGTQTDGPLFSRIEPVVRDLRRAVVNAVKGHIAQLPPQDAAHPVLRHRRDRPVRFSGSWSVRLRSGGRHSNHIHPLGWISSALYVALPEKKPGDPPDAGWLTLGQPDDLLGLDLPPWRKIEPKPGTLVLFPSIMWHGTVPFAAGERLTVAFDVAPPR